MTSKATTLLPRTTCAHCWATFAPEEVLWIASHPDLLGDAQLGPEQSQRFLPTRFDVDGNALDSRGRVCHHLACPRCHLPVPRAMLEAEPLFVSILGTPACGKSYYLAAMTWEARRVLPHFALTFTDADTVANRSLNESEELLFLNPRADHHVPLADLIRKTELQGELYDTVAYGSQSVSYPRPFLFSFQPREGHPYQGQAQQLTRILCLYDNAGEHFLAGQDSVSNPVTQHLAQSRVLLYLFDPTQDQRFRRLCQESKLPSPGLAGGRTSRQESVLVEAAARVRRYLGLPHTAKHTRPLVVVVTKLDAWAGLMEDGAALEPWHTSQGHTGLNLEQIDKRSGQVRGLMAQVCPEVVSAAESFCQKVVYVPVSALGQGPVTDPRTGSQAVRPRDIRPVGVTVPLLYGLYHGVRGAVAVFKRKQSSKVVGVGPVSAGRGPQESGQ